MSDSSGWAAICSHTASASASSSSSVVSRHTRPVRAASSAGIQLEVSSAWTAGWRPMSDGIVAVLPASGTRPSDVNGMRKRADAPASTSSQWPSMVVPIPTARPLTAATRGFGKVSTHSMNAS